jgi:hypothetical protein
MSLPRTQEALALLEAAIASNHGDIATAARSLGVDPRHVHMWMLAEPEAATAIKAAQLVGYASIESAAIRRAVHGVERPVYYKGNICGYQTEYSDGLMATVLKARVPGYNPEQVHSHSHMVNVNLMPRASNYEEWQLQRESALALPMLEAGSETTDAQEQRQRALQAPSESGEAEESVEYTEVEEPGVKLRDVL